MRILVAAVLTACLNGAAWAGESQPSACADPRTHPAAIRDVSAADILRTVDEAVREALSDLEASRLDAETSAEVEAAIAEAMAGLEADLAALDAHLDAMPEREILLSQAEEQRIDERVDAAVERVEEALERMDEHLEGATEPTAKRWRPRY